MSRAEQRVKRALRRREKRAQQHAIVEKIDALVRPLGCRVAAVGPSAVGVQGDARTYGISVIINFPLDAADEAISEISTLITNRVGQVTRVLRDIPI